MTRPRTQLVSGTPNKIEQPCGFVDALRIGQVEEVGVDWCLMSMALTWEYLSSRMDER